MPRKPGKVPSYCLHRKSGQAVVRIDGHDNYLGAYGSDQSHEQYERLIAEWRAKRTESSRQTEGFTPNGLSAGNLNVEQVLGLYWRYAKGFYVRQGVPTKELDNLKYAIRPVRRLYSSLPARQFGPLALKAVQQHLVDSGLCRNQVNARINRIKRIFKWAASEELVPPSVYEGLRTVSGLRYGRTEARESEPVKPVLDVWVEAVLPYVSAEVGAMIRLQRLTGMRPNEIVQMRICDIDMSEEVWVFEPATHKNRWRGHNRSIPLGPQAQQIVRQFTTLSMTDYLFSPAAAEERRNVDRRQARVTPMTPSQARRKPKISPKRPRGERYDVASYRRAISYGFKKAARNSVVIPPWHPNQLRHSRATEIRRLHGIEAAQVSLGHARADVTQVYAERNLELAISIAKQSG